VGVSKALIERAAEDWSPLNTARIAAAELTVTHLKEVEKRLSLRIAEIKLHIDQLAKGTLRFISQQRPGFRPPAEELASRPGPPDRHRRTGEGRAGLGEHFKPVRRDERVTIIK
jgi:hypothetical protein